MPSVMWLRLSDVSVICRVIYFQFLIRLLFFYDGQPGSTSDIGRCQKFELVSCTERTSDVNGYFNRDYIKQSFKSVGDDSFVR